MASVDLARPLALATLVLGGCASAPFAHEVEAGRFEGLDARVAAEVDAGRLSRGDAVAFARIVARSSIDTADGAEGGDRIREVGPCARSVDGSLDRRSGRDDEVGAAAAMLLIDAGIDDADAHAGKASAESGAWRAVGTRALLYSDDGVLRRARMADPDERVRLAAMRAAAVAHDANDIEPLLEAARVDPWEPARGRAIVAAAAIGGERVVLALKDLWPLASPATRQTIAIAWGMPNTIEAGGRRELALAAESEKGPAGITAAVALVAAKGAGALEAEGALERAIASGPSADRVAAIRGAPASSTVAWAAIQRASDDHDDLVSIAAMGRRLEEATDPPSTRTGLVAKLMTLASGTTVAAFVAQATLARAGIQPIAPMLIRAARSPVRSAREAAGLGLAALGDFPRAAVVAADRDAHTRTVVACAILREAKK